MTIMQWIFSLPKEIWLGALLVAGGIYWTMSRIRFVARSATTRGKVVDYDFGFRKKDIVYYPIFEFTAADGSVHRVRSAYHWKRQSLFPNRTYAIRYDPTNPREAAFRSFKMDFVMPPALVAVGVLLINPRLPGQLLGL
ncbi:MAG TPA: DUF3592 domain-containing protein [Beijerinckiaceae bacterium]|nr:DUF3592 domain-containing protein [Beijerinckiaceae bacterium]